MTAPLVSTTDRPYQLLPPLDMHQRDLLRQSIKANGVLEPVVIDEDGEILDGHHRVEIAEELGIECPRRVIDDLDRPGKYAYALTVNVARRQLVDDEARTALIKQLRLRGMSIRDISRMTGASVGKVHKELQVFTDEHLPKEVTGADGKSYASSRPAPQPTQTPEPVEAPVPAGSGQTPGAVGAVDPPAVPGPTPEPAEAPSTAPAGSGSTSPAPEPQRAAPVPTDEQRDQLPDAVVGVLAEAVGPVSALQVWSRVPVAGCHSSWVEPVLHQLTEAGDAVVVKRDSDGAPVLWAIALPDLGGGYKADPAERVAAVAEVAPEFVRPVADEPADEQRAARSLLRQVLDALVPLERDDGYLEAWVRQLGPYDAELAALLDRAHDALAALDDLISESGK
jgi:hypothetical protein